MTKTKWMYMGSLAVGVLLMAAAGGYGDGEKGEKAALSAAAAEAVKKAFPEAAIRKVELEDEDGVKVYEVELEEGDRKIEVEVAADGILIEVETELGAEELPRAVAKVVAQAAEGAEIKEVEKEEIHAVLQFVKLKTPQVVYGVELVRDGRKGEIKVAADGTVVEKLKWKGAKAKRCKESEKDITIDQVPAPAKATILKEAGDNKIEEIEKVSRNGKVLYYEAEWNTNGKEVEIKVAADGRLLEKEVEEEDDDDDNGDDDD